MTAGVEQKTLFWRRLLASVIDLMTGAFLFTLAIVAIFGASSDKVRLNGLGFSNRSCASAGAPAQVAEAARHMAPTLVWTRTALCHVGTFGLVENRFYILWRTDRVGNVFVTKSATVPVDANDRPVAPLYADGLGGLLIVLLGIALMASSLQATPGMYLTGLRLKKLDGERPRLVVLVVRLLLLLIPFALMGLIVYGVVWSAVSGSKNPALALGMPFFCLAVIGAWWRPFMLRSSWPRAPLHDILARTRVVRRGAASPATASS